jgi:hypothetical protein
LVLLVPFGAPLNHRPVWSVFIAHQSALHPAGKEDISSNQTAKKLVGQDRVDDEDGNGHGSSARRLRAKRAKRESPLQFHFAWTTSFRDRDIEIQRHSGVFIPKTANEGHTEEKETDFAAAQVLPPKHYAA